MAKGKGGEASGLLFWNSRTGDPQVLPSASDTARVETVDEWHGVLSGVPHRLSDFGNRHPFRLCRQHVGHEPGSVVDDVGSEVDAVLDDDFAAAYQFSKLGAVDVVGIGWSKPALAQGSDERVGEEWVDGFGGLGSPTGDHNIGQE